MLRNPGRDLTPAEHAWIRRQLVLLPVYLWLAFGWTNLLLRLPLSLPGSDVEVVRDFIHFYVQGIVALERDVAVLYDPDRMATIVPRVVPDAPVTRIPAAYGPQVAVFFSLLARLPYNAALFTWLAVTVTAFGACAYVVWRHGPRLRDEGALVVLLAAAFPALHFTLKFSQASAIGLACITAAFVALKNGRPFLAGVAIGMLAYKPPLGIAAACIFVAAGEWRIVAGAVTAIAFQLGVAVVYWGQAIFVDYLHALLRLPDEAAVMEPYKYHMHSWRAFFQILGLGATATLVASGVATIATLGAALAAWRSRAPLAPRFAVFVLATILVDPHLYVYDLLLLSVPLLLLWDWAREDLHCRPSASRGASTLRAPAGQRLLVPGLLYVSYFTPLLGALAATLPVQLTVLLFATLLFVVTARLVAADRDDGEHGAVHIGAARLT